MTVETRNHNIMIASIVIQLLLFTVILFGDFGFYFPGSMGDLGTWITLICAYLFVWFVSVIGAITLGENRYVLIQITIPLIMLLAVWGLSQFGDSSPREPDYQRVEQDDQQDPLN